MNSNFPTTPVECHPPTRADAAPLIGAQRQTHVQGSVGTVGGTRVRSLEYISLALVPLVPAAAPTTRAIPGGTSHPARALADPDTSRAVENNVSNQYARNAVYIDVFRGCGVVILSGSVENLSAKECAVTVAENVGRVRGVVSQLTVRADRRADADIRRDAEVARRQYPATTPSQLTVEVANAVVTPRGRFTSCAKRRRADPAAQAVLGADGGDRR